MTDVSIMVAERPPVWERAVHLHSLYCVCVIRKRLSVCMFVSFPFDFENGLWDVIVLIPDHCLSTYFLRYPVNMEHRIKKHVSQ